MFSRKVLRSLTLSKNDFGYLLFPLNGIVFDAQPEAPANVLKAGASG